MDERLMRIDGLCSPPDEAFQEWLEGIRTPGGDGKCEADE